MHRSSSNGSGFSGVETLLILVIVGLVGFVGWYVWHSRNNTTSTYNNIANTATATPKVATKSTTPAATTATNTGYLVIKEWNIKLKEGPLTQDAEYIVKDDHTAYLSTKTFTSQMGGSCGVNDSTGILYRGIAGYSTGLGQTVDSVPQPIKVGDYYYRWVGPQAPCGNPTTDSNVKTMNSYEAALSDLASTAQAI